MQNQTTSIGEQDGLEEISANVVRIPLPLPLRDLDSVNSYAIRGDDGVTLVDPGWADERSEQLLLSSLRQLGYTPGDVLRILVTHAHWDHYSRAISWQRRYGAAVFLGRQEHHTIEAFEEVEGAYPVQATLLRRAGAAGLAKTIAELELEPYERDVPFGPPDVWLEDGDQVDCGGTLIAVRATPGHTRGHVVFEDREHGLLFSGDHILPRITPSIALERAPEELPLRSYLASLRLFTTLPESRMLPAHGQVTTTVKARVHELLDHHRDRLETVLGLVAAGSSTAYEVARGMLWTRHERTIDELGPVHGMTAILEVVAHLDLLVARQLLRCDSSGSSDHYALASS
jgi:glyoxylase-like metal-dependent hydrolase (beta-lactamase superfamily II)